MPDCAEEALRDLVRARDDLRGDLMRARHRLSKLLLRHDVTFDGPGHNWTDTHRQWLARVRLPDQAAQLVLADYVGAIEALVIRRDALERSIAELVPASPWARRSPGCGACADRHPQRCRLVRRDRRFRAV